MFNHDTVTSVVAACIFVFSVSAGCASSSHRSELSAKVVDTQLIKFSKPWVRTDGGQVQVSGVVYHDVPRTHAPGHVHVDVLAEDGSVAHRWAVELSPAPSPRSRLSSASTYVLRTNFDFPGKSSVRVYYANDVHAEYDATM